MPFFRSVRQFAPLMRQSVLIAQGTGYDTYGVATFGPDVSYRAAVVGDMQKVLSANGQEVLSKQTVYLMSNVALRPGVDRITLSTQDVDTTEQFGLRPPILSVGRFPFLRGQYCTVVYL